MSREPIEALARIRQAAKEEAERAFAASLADEVKARQLAEAAEAQLCRERDFAADLSAGDGAVEAYAAWLPIGRKQAQMAWSAHDRATAGVALARASLRLAHAAAEAVSEFLERRALADKQRKTKRFQSAMDEVAAKPGCDEHQVD